MLMVGGDRLLVVAHSRVYQPFLDAVLENQQVHGCLKVLDPIQNISCSQTSCDENFFNVPVWIGHSCAASHESDILTGTKAK